MEEEAGEESQRKSDRIVSLVEADKEKLRYDVEIDAASRRIHLKFAVL